MNLYDVLDVDESASSDEIRAAWKSAIADLDPGDRRFRAFNDAAGVLLDADRRAAYDAELADQRAAEEEPPQDEPEPASEPEDEPAPVAVAAAEEAHEEPAEQLVDEPADDEAIADEPEAVEPEADEPAPVARRTSHGPGLVAIGAAAVVAVLAVLLAVWVHSLPDVKPRAQQDAQLASVSDQVEQVLADKIVPALSYDYRTLPADLAHLQKYETAKMAARQARAWHSLGPQAKQQHAVVVSHVPTDAPGVGLKRVSEDGTQAVVVAFIDQDVRKLATAPFTLKQSATFILDKDPKTGDWLLDKICTDKVCG